MLLRGCSPSAECISALGHRPPAKLPYLTREPFRLVVTQQEVGRAQGGRGRRQGVGQCQPQDPGCLKGFRAPGVKALVNPSLEAWDDGPGTQETTPWAPSRLGVGGGQ